MQIWKEIRQKVWIERQDFCRFGLKLQKILTLCNIPENPEILGSPKNYGKPWVAQGSPEESWKGLWVHSLEAREPCRGGPWVEHLRAKRLVVKGFS